jgi:hypothetical protein
MNEWDRTVQTPSARPLVTRALYGHILRAMLTPRLVFPSRSAMLQDWRVTALVAAVLLSILSLGGCVTSTPMDARAEVPGPPKPTAYRPVEDVPPRPEKPAMTADEQSKLKKELTAARDRQATKDNAKGDDAHAEPVKP